jgi:hypothetical protein
MQRIEQEGAGKREALANLETDLKVGGDMASAAKAEAEARLAIAKATPDPVLRRFEVMKAEREIAEIDSRIAENRAQAAKALRVESGGGSSGGASTIGKLSLAEVLQEDLDPYMDWMRTKSGEIKPVGGSKMSLPAVDPTSIGKLDLSIQKLKQIESDLAKGGYTGPTVGMIPESALPILAPKTKDLRDRVGSVTQEQLKATLGGQFARVEGEEFFKRGFDVSQDDAVNLKRVRSLRENLENIKNSNVARIERRLTPAMAAKLPAGTQFIGIDGKTYVARGR